MKREEAIAILQNMEYDLSNQVGSKYCQKKYESVKMAIKALEQEPIFDRIRAEIEEQVLESLSDGGDDWFTAEKVNECLEIIDKYKAGQEPCEDAISRRAVIDIIHHYKNDRDSQLSDLTDGVCNLPPVQPEQKTGHWIEKYAEDGCGERYSYWACSECGRDVGFNFANIEDVLKYYPYCNCGAKMKEGN